MREVDYLVDVWKVTGGFAVVDAEGSVIIAYRSKKHADAYAKGHANFIFGDAEHDNMRRDFALAYLAKRSERAAKPKPQLELF